MITRSTTDGMNAIALGLRLAAAQRVLTTDQEHEGGTLCWEYLARLQGVVSRPYFYMGISGLRHQLY